MATKSASELALSALLAEQPWIPGGAFRGGPCRSFERGEGADTPADLSARAAQYIRMSTDHQQYSTANQADAIAVYAAAQGLSIVKTYSDDGKSGLSVQGRGGLQQLLIDVAGGNADFRAVLVFDVSRWGRFQDSDEAAFYEYFCRRAGIRVEYCAEPFRNDGTAVSAVIKGLKRMMAGEYSRELSEKVFAGKCRLIRMGYRQGGIAGFGLRRMVIAADGTRRGVLEHGESKYLQTDRVLLVPGPKSEVAELNGIFRRAAAGWNPKRIADDLNRRGVKPPGRTPWNSQRVVLLLSNEKYVGNLVFNRFSTKLRAKRRGNPPEQWVRKDAAFPPVVSPRLFAKVQERMRNWPTRMTNSAALEVLRRLYVQHGRLSAALITRTPGVPCPHFYDHRFGGLVRAYAKVGYVPDRDLAFLGGAAKRREHARVFREHVVRLLQSRNVTADHEGLGVYRVGGRLRLAVMLACCFTSGKVPKWLVQVHAKPQPDWVLVARMNRESSAIMDYWLVSKGKGVQLGTPTMDKRSKRERFSAATVEEMLDLVLERAGIAGVVPADKA